MLLQEDKHKLEDKIRDYITFLKVYKKLSSNTINLYVAALAHFYIWKRLSKFKGKKRLVVEDKPYTKEQIRQLLEFADLRVKCIILLMCSAGLRRKCYSQSQDWRPRKDRKIFSTKSQYIRMS
jgi:hypothetical protein